MTLSPDLSRAFGTLASIAHQRSIRAEGFSWHNPEPVWAAVADFLAEAGVERVAENEDQRAIDEVAGRPDMIAVILEIADDEALEQLQLVRRTLS